MTKTFTNTLTRADYSKATWTGSREVGNCIRNRNETCCDQVKMKTNSMCSLDLCESVSFHFIGSIQSGLK